jgi:O-antigen/teichoic acid export membrane protein
LQLRLWHIARGVFSNWFTTGAMLAVGVFLQPFVVHRLGDLEYGVWVLTVSSISYLVLLDMGLNASVVRYISKGYAMQDHEGSSEALSAVLWVRLQISALILLVSGGLAALFPLLFKVPPQLALDAREAVLVVGVTTAISMTFGIFNATLSAVNRYDLKSYGTLLQLAIRLIGVVTVLMAGHGIVAIAFCELIAAAAGSALVFVLARKIYPELRITLARPKWEVLRTIWSYSFYAFLITIAVQLVYQSDNVVVGGLISTSAVTFYSIGNTLCRYTQQFLGSMTTTFCPAASTFESAGNLSALKSLYVNGTRATLVLSLPIVITLILRGQTFIGLWMGPQYARTSGIVLAILALALMFSLQNLTAGAMALGVEKHKVVAWWAVGEGIANLTLSVILARTRLGIYGVAIGTLVPSLVVHLVMWPNYVSRLVDVTVVQVFRDIWGPVFLCSIPFAVLSFAVNQMFPPRNTALFVLQTIALLPVFGVCVGFVFRENVRQQLIPRVRSFLEAYAR